MKTETAPHSAKETSTATKAEDKTLSPVRDGRRLRGDASAQRIIDATIELIAEDGISSVTMQRIAARVGSSNALVVFHFGSKDGLFAAVLQYLTDQYEALWDRTVRQPDLSATQRLMAATDCAQRFARENPVGVAAWIAFANDRKTVQLDREISLPRELGYVDEAQALIAEIAETGDYPEVNARALAEALNFLVQGAWYWNNLNPAGYTSDTLARTALILLHHSFPRHFPAVALVAAASSGGE
jgi:AcrR family transcriptional regulator